MLQPRVLQHQVLHHPECLRPIGAQAPHAMRVCRCASSSNSSSPTPNSNGGSSSASISSSSSSSSSTGTSSSSTAEQWQQQQQRRLSSSSRLGSSLQANGSTEQEPFCIIGSSSSMDDGDFSKMELQEITDNIRVRRNRIFLMMEEVRRLRVQRRLKGGPGLIREADEGIEEEYVSALPFLPPLTEQTLSTYYSVYAGFVAAIIAFGGVLAPTLELKLGVGGTSYAQFLDGVGLPSQLAQVDPIVGSFCGGTVGVLSALLVVELNNIRKQQRNRCHYCDGTGYLSCGNCVGTGYEEVAGAGVEGSARVRASTCACCASTGKVMCTGCLCTGKQLATEHDPRIDPFSA